MEIVRKTLTTYNLKLGEGELSVLNGLLQDFVQEQTKSGGPDTTVRRMAEVVRQYAE